MAARRCIICENDLVSRWAYCGRCNQSSCCMMSWGGSAYCLVCVEAVADEWVDLNESVCPDVRPLCHLCENEPGNAGNDSARCSRCNRLCCSGCRG